MILTLIIIVSLNSVNVANFPTPQGKGTIIVAEMTLRRGATRMMMPSYPEESEKNGTRGVAVAQIEINARGDVDQVDVLESPDAAIKDSVSSAVKQWRFQPQTIQGEPVRIRGKLTFYFVIDQSGRGKVENPKQPKTVSPN